MRKGATALAAVLCATLPPSLAHCRWWWPPPRSSDPGIKAGPCGSDPFGAAPPTAIQPGQLSLTFLNTVAHSGTPWRIALRREGSGAAASFEDCVLLDHIPGEVSPKTGVPDGLYRVTVTIPDIHCSRCSLQLFNPMTDKITRPSCTFDPARTIGPTGDAPLCGSNYFSCADVAINGTGVGALDAATCAPPASTAADGWPYSALEPLVYSKNEAATWRTVPDQFPTVDTFSGQVGGPTVRVLDTGAAPARFSTQVMPPNAAAVSRVGGRAGGGGGGEGGNGDGRLRTILAASLGGFLGCVLLAVLSRRVWAVSSHGASDGSSEQRTDSNSSAAGNDADHATGSISSAVTNVRETDTI